VWRLQPIGRYDTFDHVGQHGDPWTAPKSDRYGHAVASPANAAIHTDQPGRATKARPDQAFGSGCPGERSRCGRKVD
jgi:hypothetical protein